MAAIDSVYNYYLSTYAHGNTSRYDAHKKSELRDVYNRMVKVNKESPIYKLQDTQNVAKFAIDVKESARSIQNVIASLSSDEGGIENAFAKKVATSSNEDIVKAKYIGDSKSVSPDDYSGSFDIEVKQLASPQVNRGNFLPNSVKDFVPGSYAFDLNMQSASYEFQYNINAGESNRTVLEKVSRLINTANIGLKAEILENDRSQSALEITSLQTGLPEGKEHLFEIVPEGTSGSYRTMNFLGIDKVASEATNAVFTLNGNEHSSYNNVVTINKTFELTLKDVHTAGDSDTIGYKPSADAIADNLQELITSYNSVLDIAQGASATGQSSNRLLNDMRSVSSIYHSELEAIGLRTTQDGKLQIDKALLSDAVSTENSKESFSVLNAFKDALNERANAASIDPMNYVNKVVVAYKNPGHNFASSYITSAYSGMMLDRYC